MALAKKRDVQHIADITDNLPSLQFDSALSTEEKKMLILRKRAHAQNASACAQATYFVSVLNEARQVQGQLRNPESVKASRLMQGLVPRDPLMVGIIGCGRLGSHLANCILTYGEINPAELKISTRRPETLTELQEKGVSCFYHNIRIAATCHVIFLCVLPSQVQLVGNEVREHLRRDCVIYSFLPSVPLSRLKLLFGHSNVVHPEFIWPKDTVNTSWDNTLDISAILMNPTLVRQTCPLYEDKDKLVIHVKDDFAELLVYAFVNICTHLTLTRDETMHVVNAILLGENNQNKLQERITETDIARRWSQESSSFPLIDLTTVIGRDTPLTLKLVNNPVVRKQFIDRYTSVFQQYINWKNMALQKAKKM